MASSLNLDELKKEIDSTTPEKLKKKKFSKDDCFKSTREETEPDPLFDISYNPPTARKKAPDFVLPSN